MQKKTNNCDCAICKHQHDFDLPLELLNEIFAGNVTIFAGAGISTESENVLNTTLYDTISDLLNITENDLSFPSLMEKFCQRPNGRFKLLNEIKNRFDTIDSFPELKRRASRFHREIGTLFTIKNFITTNWDTYFERYCKATPFITDSDLAFWEVADRRVLKIHGSIDNFSSIIATNEDYDACEKGLNIGLIGSLLKTILATQTIIFIGYSLSDKDFASIYKYVTTQMNQLHKQAYAVTPFKTEAEKFSKLGLIPIITDGSYFIKKVKEHAVRNKLMLSDSIFEDASYFLEIISLAHDKLHETVKPINCPQVIHATTYQDGIIHALERAIEMRYSGKYSNRSNLYSVALAYKKKSKENLKRKQYNNVAYIEGYLNGLTFLLLDDKKRIEINVPKYFAFGTKANLLTFDDFIDFIKSKPEAHKASLSEAKKILTSVKNPDSILFHHPPWL